MRGSRPQGRLILHLGCEGRDTKGCLILSPRGVNVCNQAPRIWLGRLLGKRVLNSPFRRSWGYSVTPRGQTGKNRSCLTIRSDQTLQRFWYLAWNERISGIAAYLELNQYCTSTVWNRTSTHPKRPLWPTYRGSEETVGPVVFNSTS